jgi:glycogen debranching enzyme
MKKIGFIGLLFCMSIAANAQKISNKGLAHKILQDSRLDTIQSRALNLLSGFTAGTSYGEVWIRDFNTFINGSLQIHKKEKVKDLLLAFFRFQGKDGNIVDGYIPDEKADKSYMPDRFIYSNLMPGYAAHKNTVETDQESSLIQAIGKYIDYTSDTSILDETVNGISVLKRMEMAMNFILTKRWSPKHGLVIGATTVDWGDVQPDTSSIGVEINKETKWAIDVYDNAMFYMAIHDFVRLAPKSYRTENNWVTIAAQLKRNTRTHLWRTNQQKYVPHIYLKGSPFSADFKEDDLLYSGGSACAVLAGLNTVAEIKQINQQLLVMAAKEKYATIGVTVYPPYPLKEFPNMAPYVYQNAGDWTWFGGRFVQGLIKYNLVEEAYTDLNPMIDRVLKNKGFYEWYDIRTGTPKGSGEFRGEAGVLLDAIVMLRNWAKLNQ